VNQALRASAVNQDRRENQDRKVCKVNQALAASAANQALKVSVANAVNQALKVCVEKQVQQGLEANAESVDLKVCKEKLVLEVQRVLLVLQDLWGQQDPVEQKEQRATREQEWTPQLLMQTVI
jgi:hypothetical protein